jgi:hypothetical protein
MYICIFYRSTTFCCSITVLARESASFAGKRIIRGKTHHSRETHDALTRGDVTGHKSKTASSFKLQN